MTKEKQNRRGAPTGSKNAMKFCTPESRQELYEAAIAHLERGLDRSCFIPCDWQTLEKYMIDFPDTFDADKLAQASRKGRQVIENLIMSNAIGKTKGNAATVIFIAKNKLGWRDKVQLSGDADAPLMTADMTAEQAAEIYKRTITEF
jgi:hypothetical protein